MTDSISKSYTAMPCIDNIAYYEIIYKIVN